MKEKLTEVITYLADVTPLLEEEYYKKIYNIMPEFRKRKADRLRYQADKAQSVGAWWLWMLMQEQYHLPEDISFNLSHSGKYVLCSAAPEGQKVGCDIEIIKDFHETLVRRCFCPDEAAHIMACSEPERTEVFYRYWVLKESFIKATRQGMHMRLDSFEFKLPENNIPYLTRCPKDIKETFYFHEYSVNQGKLAICSTCPKFSKKIKIIEY